MQPSGLHGQPTLGRTLAVTDSTRSGFPHSRDQNACTDYGLISGGYCTTSETYMHFKSTSFTAHTHNLSQSLPSLPPATNTLLQSILLPQEHLLPVYYTYIPYITVFKKRKPQLTYFTNLGVTAAWCG